ncbi:hypothetical protein GCM10020221_25020 [Streptomyces thioluteus]|uniref:Transposase n=1 Tax=Streptomyces thioluteus TaxID=66431 RepID=A0ABP6JEQ9_STRTU
MSIVAVACRSPRRAREWNVQELQAATGVARAKHSHCQLRNWRAGTMDSTSTGTDSRAVISTRFSGEGSSVVPPADPSSSASGGSGRAAV